MFHLYINKKRSYFVQPYALHGYKSLYAHPDLEYYITYLHDIWLLVRTIAHDLHASVVVASYTLHTHLQKVNKAWL